MNTEKKQRGEGAGQVEERVYAIGDLHLSFGGDKPMDVFRGWEDYVSRLERSWRATVRPKDTVVVVGDISWAMSLEGTKTDFAFLHTLPGRKLLIKGNHDYWWNTKTKIDRFLEENGFDSLHVLHNNSYQAGPLALCGTRGWMFEENAPENAKVANREAQRLALSLQSAETSAREKVAFVHYPVVYANSVAHNMVEVLLRYGVKRCYYGHLHGRTAHQYALNGMYEGIQFELISADYLGFELKEIPALPCSGVNFVRSL